MSNMLRRTALKAIGAGTAGLAGLASSNGVAADNHVAQIQAIHAVPDAPAVDIYADDELVAEDVAFKDITSLTLPSGATSFSVTPTGSGPGAAVASWDLTFEGGESYTLVVLGELSEGTVEIKQFSDETSVGGRFSGSSALARVVHAVPDEEDVDITVTVSTANTDREADVPNRVRSDLLSLIDLFKGTAGGYIPQFVRNRVQTPGLFQFLADVPEILVRLTLFNGVEYASASDYLKVPSGPYTFQLRRETEDAIPADDPFLFGDPLTLLPGETYTVVAVGYGYTGDEPVDEPVDVVVASS
ncbi:hypothetical protein C2R22_11330 [Salinigranum rubrum]|uniref:DUF4397 domain-containing protein n=1 Tax=Salinigranum rubrum TaxID=755307 RepID=A0A2I8VJP8_9EURY|nr:DUF4397 domain-containing protein [Salinigranum rubrum]AUV82167.1 hypothetical protein C2R22_11330 [Salinigranum rubrum]